MTNSTFWHDGYCDAESGARCSPPAPEQRHSGVCNVKALEYEAGYRAGLEDRERFEREEYLLSRDLL